MLEPTRDARPYGLTAATPNRLPRRLPMLGWGLCPKRLTGSCKRGSRREKHLRVEDQAVRRRFEQAPRAQVVCPRPSPLNLSNASFARALGIAHQAVIY